MPRKWMVNTNGRLDVKKIFVCSIQKLMGLEAKNKQSKSGIIAPMLGLHWAGIENEKQNKNRRWLKFLAYMAVHIAGVAKLVGLRMARKRCCFTYTRGNKYGPQRSHAAVEQRD